MSILTTSPVSRLDASTVSIIECLPHACPTFDDLSLCGGVLCCPRNFFDKVDEPVTGIAPCPPGVRCALGTLHHLSDMILALQPQNRYLPAHQLAKLIAQIERQRDSPPFEGGHCVPFRFENPNEFAHGLFTIAQSARGFIETFIFNGIVVHLDRLSCGSRRQSVPPGAGNTGQL